MYVPQLLDICFIWWLREPVLNTFAAIIISRPLPLNVAVALSRRIAPATAKTRHNRVAECGTLHFWKETMCTPVAPWSTPSSVTNTLPRHCMTKFCVKPITITDAIATFSKVIFLAIALCISTKSRARLVAICTAESTITTRESGQALASISMHIHILTVGHRVREADAVLARRA